MKENKNPISPHKTNIFGRYRYSVDTKVNDYVDYSFDDIWSAIAKLWGGVILITVFLYMQVKRLRK